MYVYIYIYIYMHVPIYVLYVMAAACGERREGAPLSEGSFWLRTKWGQH